MLREMRHGMLVCCGRYRLDDSMHSTDIHDVHCECSHVRPIFSDPARKSCKVFWFAEGSMDDQGVGLIAHDEESKTLQQVQSPSLVNSVSIHVRALDGIRGVAVLAVMSSHLFRSNYVRGGLLGTAVGRVFSFGAKGVDLFFVLSGFLITGILYDSLHDTGYFRKFYTRRCLRIFPLYYGVLIVLFALTSVLEIHWNKMQWSLLLYLQNTNLLFPIWNFGHPHGLDLMHFWSLAVEEQFYFVWPLAVFLIRDRKKLLVACGVGFVGAFLYRYYLVLHDAPYQFINCSTLCRADSLLAGGALALLVRGPEKVVIHRFARPVFWGAAVFLGVLNILGAKLAAHPGWESKVDANYLAIQYSIFAIGFAGLIGWCLQSKSFASAIFEIGILRWFGKYSYGLYIYHLILWSLFVAMFRVGLERIFPNRSVAILGSGLIVLMVSIAVAYASYHLYEKVFLNMKRFVRYQRPETIPISN
jgi:peptidoglycan/LPS O-acetylase OafA/YrhL